MTNLENEEMITVSKDEYEELLRETAFLDALRGAGVDNWDGYDYAWELFREEYPEYSEK